MANEDKVRHLEMIQGIVNRLSTNSFLLKGWSVVSISALIAVAIDKGNYQFALVALLPSLILWGLDGYFLWHEWAFRQLYDAVRKLDGKKVDFSMDVSAVSLGWQGWIRKTFSKTLIIFHGAITGTIVVVVCLLKSF